MSAEEILEAVSPFVGRTVALFEHEDYVPDSPGDWRDDEPLIIHFTDGSALSISAGGWHDSGCLYVDAKEKE